MPGENKFAGLNQNGLILFIILIVVCLPLCWLPWIIGGCKADVEGGSEGEE